MPLAVSNWNEEWTWEWNGKEHCLAPQLLTTDHCHAL